MEFEAASDSPSEKVRGQKRLRTIFTSQQLQILESNFQRQQYIVGHERKKLAATLSLTEVQVSGQNFLR